MANFVGFVAEVLGNFRCNFILFEDNNFNAFR